MVPFPQPARLRCDADAARQCEIRPAASWLRPGRAGEGLRQVVVEGYCGDGEGLEDVVCAGVQYLRERAGAGVFGFLAACREGAGV